MAYLAPEIHLILKVGNPTTPLTSAIRTTSVSITIADSTDSQGLKISIAESLLLGKTHSSSSSMPAYSECSGMTMANGSLRLIGVSLSALNP